VAVAARYLGVLAGALEQAGDEGLERFRQVLFADNYRTSGKVKVILEAVRLRLSVVRSRLVLHGLDRLGFGLTEFTNGEGRTEDDTAEAAVPLEGNRCVRR
jgi:hypothetical protein